MATDIFGFIKYNPSITLRLPKYNSLKKTPKDTYIHKMK